MKYFGRSVLALGLVVLPLSVSYATPLNIVATGGGIGMSKSTPAPFSDVGVFLTGSDFTLTNDMLTDSFAFTGGNPGFILHHAGDTVDFSGLVFLSSPSDALFLDGIRFFASGQLNVAVPRVSVASEISAPFTLTGSVHGQGPPSFFGPLTVDVAITGAGTMTAIFEPTPGQMMELSRVSYHLVAPVPEPSAWLLVASGLGALGLLRRTHLL
jgi:hypothetical protein